MAAGPASRNSEYDIEYPSQLSGQYERQTPSLGYNQRLLLQEINKSNLGKYDFFYVPID